MPLPRVSGTEIEQEAGAEEGNLDLAHSLSQIPWVSIKQHRRRLIACFGRQTVNILTRACIGAPWASSEGSCLMPTIEN